MKLVFTVVCIALLATSLAHAEVLELEGTVKAVDATARSITIERKTPKGTKTLELEVTKKAGDLSSVKAGDTISFSYDPDLELVTKLGGGSGNSERKVQNKQCRIRLSISDTGEVDVEIDRLDKPPAPATGERKPLGNGRWQVTHAFDTPRAMNFFDGGLAKPINARLDVPKGALVLSPKKSQGFDNPAAKLVYPLRVRVPFTLECDFTTTGKSGWPSLQIYAEPRAANMERPVFDLRTKSALVDDIVFDAWSSKMGVKEGEHLVKETRVDAELPWRKKFRLPVPNVRSEDFYTVTLGSVAPEGETTSIHRLAVSAFLVPLLGMGLDQNGDVVFVKQVFPQSFAAKAGVKEGDVVATINNRAPTSGVNAIEMLAKTGIGEACKIGIKRGDEEKTLTLTPDWPDK